MQMSKLLVLNVELHGLLTTNVLAYRACRFGLLVPHQCSGPHLKRVQGTVLITTVHGRCHHMPANGSRKTYPRHCV